MTKGFQRFNTSPCSGLLVIDLRRGEIAHWLSIAGIVKEIDNVAILPNKRRPMAYGLKNPDEIRHVVTLDEEVMH